MKHLFLLLIFLNLCNTTYTASELDANQELCDDGTVACAIGAMCLIAPCTIGTPLVVNQPTLMTAHCCMTRSSQQCLRPSPVLCPNELEIKALIASGSIPCCLPLISPCTIFPLTGSPIPNCLCQVGTAFCIIPFISSYFLIKNSDNNA